MLARCYAVHLNAYYYIVDLLLVSRDFRPVRPTQYDDVQAFGAGSCLIEYLEKYNIP